MKRKTIVLFVLILFFFTVNAIASKNLEINIKNNLISINATKVKIETILQSIETNTNIRFVWLEKKEQKKSSIKVSDIPTSNISLIMKKFGFENHAVVFDKKQNEILVYILPKGISPDYFIEKYPFIQNTEYTKWSKNNSLNLKGKQLENIYKNQDNKFSVQCIKNEIILKISKSVSKKEYELALQKFGLQALKSSSLEKIGYIKAKICDGKSINDIIPALQKSLEFSIFEPNYIINTLSEPINTYQWYINDAGFNKAWPLIKNNKSVNIAVLDTGVNANHPDLQSKVFKGYDFYNNDEDASDDNGHGTFVAGIIAASEKQLGLKGLYESANIIPVKVIGEKGQGTYEDTALGIIWAVDNNAQIINLSIGAYAFSNLLQDAINYALEKGCVIVAASGNEGLDKEIFPAAFPDVIAVSALGQNGKIWLDSNKGNYIDFCAPGENILSTGLKDSYVNSNGTSASAAIVSALASILISEKPNIPGIFIRQIIAQTADDLGTKGRDKIYGYGKINAYAAVSQKISNFHDLTIRSVKIENSIIKKGKPVVISAHLVNVGTYPKENCTVILSQFIKNKKNILDKKQLNISTVKDVIFKWIPQDQVKNVQFEVTVNCEDDSYPSNNKAFSHLFDIEQDHEIITIKHKSEVEFPVHEFIAGEAWELIRRYMDVTQNTARVLSFSETAEFMTAENVHQNTISVYETENYSSENHDLVFKGSKKMLAEFDDHIGERILHECGKSLKRSELAKPVNGILNNLSAPDILDYVAEAGELGTVSLSYSGKIRDDAAQGYILSEYSRDFPFSIYYHTMQMSGARDVAYELFIEDVFDVNLPWAWWSTGEPYTSEDSYDGAENNESGIWGSLTISKYKKINLGNDDIIEGTHEEDVYEVVRNHSHFMGVTNSSNFDHHFWEPDTYNRSAFNDGLFMTGETSWTVSEKLYAFAVELYKQGKKDKAFYYLGRVAHLLEDMGCPPHVHNDPHPSYAPYEYTMGKVFFNDLINDREQYIKGRSIYLKWHSDTLKKELKPGFEQITSMEIRENPDDYFTEEKPLKIISLDDLRITDPEINKSYAEYKDLLEKKNVIKIEKEWANRSDLFRLFYSLTELTDDFPSGDYDGDIIKNSSNDDSDMKDYNSYHFYAPVIQPAIIEHLATLYLMFWKDTHAFVKSKVTDETGLPVANVDVAIFEEDNDVAIDIVKTDENGNYEFFDIESEKNHYIRASKSSYIGYTSNNFQTTIANTVENIDISITAIRPLVTNLFNIEDTVQEAVWTWDADQPASYRYSIDQNETWTPSGEFSNLQSASIGDNDGKWYIHVQAKNIDDVISEVYTVSANLDNTPPLNQASFIELPYTLTNKTFSKFIINSDEGSHYKYKIDNELFSSEFIVDTPIQLTGLTDGPHMITVIVRDDIGNWQEKDSGKTFQWTIDTVKPIISELYDDITPVKSKIFQWEITENSKYRYTIDQDPQGIPAGEFSSLTSITTEGLNGKWYLHLQAMDQAKNLSGVKTVSAVFDNLPPVPKFERKPENFVNTTDAEFVLLSEDISLYRYKLDNSIFGQEISIDKSIQLKDLTHGTHNIQIITADELNNWQLEEEALQYTWVVDLVSPEIIGLINDSKPKYSKTWKWSANEKSTYRYAIDQNENWTAMGDFENITTTTKENINGQWFFHVQAKDDVGNISEVTTVSALFDNKPPVPELISTPKEIENNIITSFQLVKNDATHYKFKIDNLDFSEETPIDDIIQIENLPDGLHSIKIIVRDEAGNWQTEDEAYNYTWTIDRILPVISGISDDEQPLQSKTWQWEANEKCTFRYSIDQQQDWLASGDFTNLTNITKDSVNGSWYLHVQAMDEAGNISEVKTVSALFDNIPPLVQLSKKPDPLINTREIIFTISDDDIYQYKYSIDGSEFGDAIPKEEPLQLKDLTDGLHSIEFIVRDLAGNWLSESSANSYTWIVDTVKPILSGIENDLTPGQSKIWNWTANEKSEFRWQIDQNPQWAANGPFTDKTSAMINDTDGTWYLHLQAKDLAGNLSEIINVSAILDNTPSTILFLKAPKSYINTPDIVFELGGEDVTHYKYRLLQNNTDFSDPIIIGQPVELKALEDGAYTIEVLARDQAGNWTLESSSHKYAWNIDTVKPQVMGLKDDFVPTKSKTWQWISNEECTYRYVIDQNLEWKPSGNFMKRYSTSLKNMDGKWYIHLQAKDRAGNLSETNIASVILDNTPPVNINLMGTPEPLDFNKSIEINVSGEDIYYYKYKLDELSYSDTRTITQTLSLTNLTEGSHTLTVFGSDIAGNWQAESNATVHSWTVKYIIKGDINNDEQINLKDAILSIEVLSGFTPMVKIYNQANINADNNIGLAEIIFLLQEIAY